MINWCANKSLNFKVFEVATALFFVSDWAGNTDLILLSFDRGLEAVPAEDVEAAVDHDALLGAKVDATEGTGVVSEVL